MKQISVAIFIILLVVGGAFFMRDRSARAELQDAGKQITTLSNEVAKVKTIMVMHSVTNSELQGQIAKSLERINALSNRVAKAAEDLRQAQREQETLKANTEMETKKASAADIRAEQLQTEVRTLLAMIEGRNTEIARLTPKLREAEADRADYYARMQKAEADVVRLQLDQTDEAALRAQLKRLNRQWPPNGFARVPKHSLAVDEGKGAKSLTARVNSQASGYYLQMQPDGTVRLVPPLEAVGAPR